MHFGCGDSVEILTPVGSNLTLDSTNYTVIGILPAKFEFPLLGGSADLWVTRIFLLNITMPEHIRSGAGYLSAVGRLRPGLRVREAQAEMEVLSRQYRQVYPAMPDAAPNLQIRISDLRERTVANVRPAILMLAGAVGLLLLIACANVASLLLARALARRREMAVRAALGASRLTLIRQLLTESVLLAFISGAAGILIGNWTIAAVASWASSHLPRASAIAMDARALAFTLGISLLTGVLFGLAPAIQISRPDLNAILRAEGRGASGTRRRNLLGNLLVASQVALSVILLVSAGLLIRSFVRLQSLALGCDPRNVLTLTLSLPPTRYSTAQQMVAFYDRLVKEVEKVPGVTSAAVASALPVNPSRISPVLAEGQPAVPLAQRPLFVIQTISTEYPLTLRVPLLRGREFSENDTSQSSRVALVNDTLVRRFWSHENPIGKHLLLGRMAQPTEVVGVVADVRNISLAAAAEPEVILPFPQLPWAAMNLIVRTGVTPRSVVEAVRQALARVDPDQPVTAVRTLEEVLASSESQRRFTMYLLGAFSICALLLAVVGIYGVISYSVEDRRQEMGIRIAIGAARGDILWLVVGQALRVAAGGVITGLAAALVVTRWMAALLFQVTATDPLSLAGTATLLIAVAAIASYLPAHRAACSDPVRQLRPE